MEEKPDSAPGGLLPIIVLGVVLLPVVIPLIFLKGLAGTLAFVAALVAFTALVAGGAWGALRLSRLLGERADVVFWTAAIPGSFFVIAGLRSAGLNESGWSKLFVMVLILATLVGWLDATGRLGAEAPPLRNGDREIYRIALGPRLFSWIGGIVLAFLPFGAWLQEGGWWWLLIGLVWLAVGCLVVKCMHIRRVIVERNVIRANDCHDIWTERPLNELRGITAPTQKNGDFPPWILQFDRGPDLAIPGTLASRDALIAKLRARLAEQPQNA